MRIDADKVRELAEELGSTISEIARVADLNPQTFYKKKPKEQFGHKSTRKILEAAEIIRQRGTARVAG